MSKRRKITTFIESITPDGAGAGTYTEPNTEIVNKPIKVFGAFPGETVTTQIYKKKDRTWIGVPEEIIDTPLKRVEPRDSVYLSSSPWQGIRIEDELRFKLDIAKDVFKEVGPIKKILDSVSPKDIVAGKKDFEYRNKMEYHLYEDDGEFGNPGNIVVAIFGRKEKRRVEIKTNALSVPGLHEFVEIFIRDITKLVAVGRSLKTMIVRSISTGTERGALFIKDEAIGEKIKNVIVIPQNEAEKAFSETYKERVILYYSNPDSPASVIDGLIYTPENTVIETELLGTSLQFGLMSFFQVNIEVAEMLLLDLSNRVVGIIQNDFSNRVVPHSLIPSKINILDYYSGVGTIGLVLMEQIKKQSPDIINRVKMLLVEENKEASAYATINAKRLELENVEVLCGDSSDFTERVAEAHILIVDPPRSGLHARFVGSLLRDKPEYLIYQSCNIETQARDLKLLLEHYEVLSFDLYNFFPKTPHIESLIFLKRKG